jgi:hypothetical protein
MVHALREAHRVIKPAGLLIDLRPRSAHRPVGITCDSHLQSLGIVYRNIDDVRAANRAVVHVLRAGWFKSEERVRFDCNRIMDAPGEFQAWWDEFAHIQLDDGVLRKIKDAFKAKCEKRKIVVETPLAMQKLRKVNDAVLSKIM